MIRLLLQAILLALLALCSTGCNSAPPPEAIDVPAIVGELDQLHLSIAEAMRGESVDGGEPEIDFEDAHDMLHRVGYLLTRLSNLTAAPQMDAATCAEIAKTAETVMDGYNEIDSVIHEGGKPDYDAVHKQISEGVEKLKSLLP